MAKLITTIPTTAVLTAFTNAINTAVNPLNPFKVIT